MKANHYGNETEKVEAIKWDDYFIVKKETGELSIMPAKDFRATYKRIGFHG